MSEKQVHVIVTNPVGEDCIEKIAAVSQQVIVTDVTGMINAERNGESVPDDRFDSILADAEVMFGKELPRSLMKRAPNLKWIQTISAGIDHLLGEDVIESPVEIATIKGMSSTQVAEFVFGVALIFVKKLSLCFQLKQEKQWHKYRTAGLQNKTIGIIGYGHIGKEVARLAKAFGMRVIAMRRSGEQPENDENVDLMLPKDSLEKLLGESDFAIVSVPRIPETERMIGEKELRCMKSTAYLINIARGGIVEEEALIQALEEGWIAGAGLDVFADEPLPSDSRLWEIPNLVFSPHVSGDTEEEYEMATELFIDNLKNYLDGKGLTNLADKKKLY